MHLNLKDLTISSDSSLKDALLKIEKNKYGLIFTLNKKNEVDGLATDGDIRRSLVKGIKLEDKVSKCANSNFVWADSDTPRETLIKQLDNNIAFIPLLDKKKRLTSVITRDSIPLSAEQPIYIRSRAPVRVSFGGGGSDLTHYFSAENGAVINSSISIYSHAVMRVRSDSRIIIKSLDLKDSIDAKNIEELFLIDKKFGLIQSLLKVINPKFGFELYLNSDFPVGSGLGGSASVAAAILGCFNHLRNDRWDSHDLAEIAFQAERLHLGIAGGWQDQYAAVFGGFNFIEFEMEKNVIHPIRLKEETILELEESLILCGTGLDHHSGNIHDDQKATMTSSSVRSLVKENVKLTYLTRNHLLRGRLTEFGKCLHKAWELKKNFSDMITNDHIDRLYDNAIKNGAIGGKLLGAGGGGFFIFYVNPFDKHKLIEYLESESLEIRPFKFDLLGLKTWTVRDRQSKSYLKEIK